MVRWSCDSVVTDKTCLVFNVVRSMSLLLKLLHLPAPFIKDMNPSFLMTCMPQSMDPLYLTACPDVIIMRRRMVSIGYEMRPEVTVTAAKLNKKMFRNIFWNVFRKPETYQLSKERCKIKEHG